MKHQLGMKTMGSISRKRRACKAPAEKEEPVKITGLGDVVQNFFLFLSLAIICSAKWKHFSDFGKMAYEEHFCEIILKSGLWPRRRCCLKIFSIFSSSSHFVLPSRTILEFW